MPAKEGSIDKEAKGKRRWLSRLGKFMMYGGWMLVLIVVFGIVILISILTSGS